MELNEQLSLMRSKKLIFIDTETTSRYRPDQRYARLIEVAAIKVEDDQIVDTFQQLINPRMPIPKAVVEITGITNEMVMGKPGYETVLGKLYEFCKGDYVFVFHNANFDMAYLNYYGERIGVKFTNPIIDTLYLSKQVIPYDKEKKGQYKLETLCKNYGIEDKNHHRAMNDVMVTFGYYKKLKQLCIEKYGEGLSYDVQRQTTFLNNEVDNFYVTKISVWEKWNKHRLYVTLFASNEVDVANVFYDFDNKTWRVKDTTFAIKDMNDVERKVLDFKKVENMNRIEDFY